MGYIYQIKGASFYRKRYSLLYICVIASGCGGLSSRGCLGFGLFQFDLVDVLFFFAVVAFQGGLFFVGQVEKAGHRFVVGDAFRVGTAHDVV